jgi:hypothetical protein
MGQVRTTKEERTKSIWRVGMKQNQHNKKSPLSKEECAHVLVLRMHHVGTSAGSEQSERRSEPHMSIAVEEQV